MLRNFLATVLPKKDQPTLFLFGFNKWKTFMRDWFPDKKVVFVSKTTNPGPFSWSWRMQIPRYSNAEVMAWQYQGPADIKAYCAERGIPFHYVEDGFIRSLKLGAMHTPPMSLVFDKMDMHFNAEAPTELETILSTHDFDADPALLERAKKAIAVLRSTGLSKYNMGAAADPEQLYGPKTRKRVLVIGQVERDASIVYGSRIRYTNNDLVRLAWDENSGAQIIYKPHPEVFQGIAKPLSDSRAISNIAQILDGNVSLAASLETIDHVYVITSLSGFEALMRGVEVTTLGCPFYAGWGLTDDRQPNERRVRRLTLEQVFAAAYILYPAYFDPVLKNYIQIEDALSSLLVQKSAAQD